MEIHDEALGLPDEETMSTDQGLFENHHYRDMRGYDADDYGRIWEDEEQLLEYDGDLGADDAYEVFEDNEVYRMDLDPGVASTVIALSVIGAVPFTSCSGGPGHSEQHPLVVFWATPKQANKVLAAADGIEGLEVEGVGTSGVMVYTFGDVSLMREFAQTLMGKR